MRREQFGDQGEDAQGNGEGDGRPGKKEGDR